MIFDVQDGYRPFPHSPLFTLGDMIADPAHFTVMQWTGLTDKNGVEIYEGELLRAGVNSFINIEVLWDSESATFRTRFLTAPKSLMPMQDASYVEVIGNIHQNPNLLLS